MRCHVDWLREARHPLEAAHEALLTSGKGSDKPPKTVEELAKEQGLSGDRPDYRALATAVWQTGEELAEFEEDLKQARRSGAA